MKKKTLIISAISVVAAAAIATGGTLAYFTQKTDTVKNTFTVGKVAITLDEAQVTENTDDYGMTTWTVNEEAERVTENTYTAIYPGAELPKDPTVTVEQGSNPCYVRMKLSITDWNKISQLYNEFNNQLALDEVFGNISYNWSIASTDYQAGSIVLNYNGIINAKDLEQILDAPFTSITIPSMFDNREMEMLGGNDGKFKVKITAEAIQAEGFADSGEAWAAFDAQINPAVNSVGR